MVALPPGFQSARRRRPPRWGRRAAWTVAALGLALLAGWWFSKGPVETAVRAKLMTALQRRGFAVRIGGIDWNRRTHLRLTGVELQRPDLKIAIDSIDLDASGHYLVRGDLRIVSVDLGPTRVTVRSTGGATPASPSGGGAGRGVKLLAPGATVSLTRLETTIERSGRPLAFLQLNAPEIDFGAGEISIVGDGKLRFGERLAPVHFEARRGGGRLVAEARSTAPNIPLVEFEDPAHGRVRVGGGTIEQVDGALRLRASALDVRLGPEAQPVVQVLAETTGYSKAEGLVFEGGSARTWGDPRAALPHARGLYRAWRAQMRVPSTTPPAPSDPPESASVATRKLRLQRFELVAADGWRMTDATLTVEGETVSVDGLFGGGRLTIGLTPRAARLEARAVRLSAAWAGVPLAGTLSGTVVVERDPLRVRIDGGVVAGELTHPAIAEAPIKGIDAGFTGTVAVDKGTVAFSDARVRLGKAVAVTSLSLSGLPDDPLSLKDGWPSGLNPIIDLRAKVEPVRCQDAVAGLPRALLGPLRDVQVAGFFRPELRLRLPFGKPKKVLFRAKGISKGGCDVTALNLRAEGRPPADVAASLSDVAWLSADFVLPVREGVSEGAEIKVGPGTADYVLLEEMPAYVGGAAYLSEEMGFYTGSGISLPLIAKALGTNLTRRRFAYGGSTVTQQLVKNLFLTRRKTLARKLQEAIISARIAKAVSKDRVLELYLNCIEFGPDLYGVGRAAAHYFQKDAADLTPMEAVFLAMLKPSPRRGRWYVRKGRTPKMAYWDQRARLLLERLEKRELVPPGTADAAAPYILRWDGNGRYLGADTAPTGTPLRTLSPK